MMAVKNRPNKTAQLQSALNAQGLAWRVTWDNDKGFVAAGKGRCVYLGHCYKVAAMVVSIGIVER